ncbi:PREDICTED: uncharacterized protein LOC104767456, partial [Camelina sativa]|uniref:Uncharacterized protein LOC104767456 n=1 Tax=Camelina sativa TaxID=90675 RepID=A0ABM0XRD4_CAMSA
MHALTNSGAVLLAVLLFFLLILVAELSYIFCRRTGSLPSPASQEMEEHAVAAAALEEDVTAADKWRVSRLLFTIEEEDLDQLEDDNDDVASVEVDTDGELRVDVPMEYSGDPTPFLTPCDSPPYFTPSPSPGRD